jgi:hypothetical protein
MNQHPCRHCGSPLEHTVIDLGHQPPSNAYLRPEQLVLPEITYPLRVYLCRNCWLVQLPAHAAAEELFTADYAYFSSTSSSWCTHAERFVAAAVERLALGPQSQVVELASNDGYLLQYVQRSGIPCLGIEPTHATAEAARALGRCGCRGTRPTALCCSPTARPTGGQEANRWKRGRRSDSEGWLERPATHAPPKTSAARRKGPEMCIVCLRNA